MTPAIDLRGVSKRFLTPSGGVYTALRDLNLTVQAGEFCAVVGPTGCGKSTTLALISGLEPASEGEVEVLGKPVRGIAEHIGYVFQTDAVFPWKTVLDNVAAGPRYHGRPTSEARSTAREWISRVGLSGFEDRYPYQLSGGMRKRVALAQSLINNPRILLMDEPFSALDVQTRSLMEDELLTLWASTSASVVFVTHDLEEAIALADRVVVITAGPGTVKGTYKVDLPRPLIVYALRLAFAALWIGAWEVSPRLSWVDPFFVGQPSGVVSRLWTWITEGTALGPLWLQAVVTMEEAVLGFVIGSALGVRFCILLRPVGLLRRTV